MTKILVLAAMVSQSVFAADYVCESESYGQLQVTIKKNDSITVAFSGVFSTNSSKENSLPPNLKPVASIRPTRNN